MNVTNQVVTVDATEILLQRSRKRTKTLSLRWNGNWTLCVPATWSDGDVARWLQRNEQRVSEWLARANTADHGHDLTTPWHLHPPHYLGRPLAVQRTESRQQQCRLTDETLEVSAPLTVWNAPSLPPVVLASFRRAAQAYIGARVRHWSQTMRISYGRVTIRDQKSRWGSCSSQGNLNFNWRLMQAPPEVIDYVVVHELCHRLEMNHSHRFWSLVGRYCPDYERAKIWLRREGSRLLT